MCIKIDETTTRHDGMIVRWRIGSSTWLSVLGEQEKVGCKWVHGTKEHIRELR